MTQPAFQPDNRPTKSVLPILIAAVVVIVTAISLTLYLVLREGGSDKSADDVPQTVAERAEAVMQQFVEAFDAEDQQGLIDTTRGILGEHAHEFGHLPGGYQLAGQTHSDTVTAEVEHGQIALVYWEFYAHGETGVFTAMMFAQNDADGGFKICNALAEPESSDQVITLDYWLKHYAEDCQVDGP